MQTQDSRLPAHVRKCSCACLSIHLPTQYFVSYACTSAVMYGVCMQSTYHAPHILLLLIRLVSISPHAWLSRLSCPSFQLGSSDSTFFSDAQELLFSVPNTSNFLHATIRVSSMHAPLSPKVPHPHNSMQKPIEELCRVLGVRRC